MRSEETIKKVATIFEDVSKLFADEKAKQHYESMASILRWALDEEVD